VSVVLVPDVPDVLDVLEHPATAQATARTAANPHRPLLIDLFIALCPLFAVDVAVNSVETTEGTKKSDPVIEICYHLPRAARRIATPSPSPP
jgi:hypothetical protein